MNIDFIPIKKRGTLCFIESGRDVPFEIKRMYYVFGEKDGTHRGKHAHKTQHEMIVCVYGKIKVLLDDGKERTEIILDDPAKGLLLQPHFWRETFWMQDDSVLCVVSADYYDENDYISDYDEFVEKVKGVYAE